MKLGVTPYTVQLLTLPTGDESIRAAEFNTFSELATREQVNRPSNEDQIRGIV